MVTKCIDSYTYTGLGTSSVGDYFLREKYSEELLKAAAVGATQRVRMFLARGADVDHEDTREYYVAWTALHYAAEGGFAQVVNLLIEHGCILSSKARYGETALFRSILAGHIAVANIIAQSDGIDASKETPALLLAAQYGHDGVMQGLIRANCDPNHTYRSPDDIFNGSLLYYAADAGHTSVVRTLLATPTIHDCPSNGRRGSALYAAILRKNTEIVRMLLGSATLRKNNDAKIYESLLYYAVQQGSLEIVECLLSDSRINKNWQGPNSLNAVDVALFKERPDILDLLIDHGCGVSSRDCSQWTPLHIAAGMGSSHENMKRLLEEEADINARDENCQTPLFWAARSGDLNAIGLLQRAGASSTMADTRGYTPLHLAASCGDPSSLSMLLKEACETDLNTRNNEGYTPLHYAACFGRHENVRRLVEAGADVCSAIDGKTPLDMARESPHKDDSSVDYLQTQVAMQSSVRHPSGPGDEAESAEDSASSRP